MFRYDVCNVCVLHSQKGFYIHIYMGESCTPVIYIPAHTYRRDVDIAEYWKYKSSINYLRIFVSALIFLI